MNSIIIALLCLSNRNYAFNTKHMQIKSLSTINYDILSNSNVKPSTKVITGINATPLQYNNVFDTEAEVSNSLVLTSISNARNKLKLSENSEDYIIPKESYIVLGMLFFMTALCSLDRVAMSVAIIPMALELGYNEEIKGTISTMFSFGYMFGIIPAGILGSILSPTSVLALGVFTWSFAQAISPWAAHISLPLLLFCRFCMGLAEAAAIPTVQSFVSRFVPEEKKSLILGIILSGLQVGNVGAFLFSPTILDATGWPGLLIAYGLLGLVWIAVWLPFAKDQPSNPLPIKKVSVSDQSGLTSAITNLVTTPVKKIQSAIASKVVKQPKLSLPSQINSPSVYAPWSTEYLNEKLKGILVYVNDIPFKEIVSSKSVQAIAVAHSVQNFGLYINLSWLPTYFNGKFGLSVDDSSLASVLPWVAGAIVGPLSGALADKLIGDGVDKTFVRKVMQTFALITPAAALVSLSLAQDLTTNGAISYFVIAVASAATFVAGFGSSTQDICASPKYVSVIYSVTSAPAVLVGSLGVYLTGVILDNFHSFSLVFQGTAVIYVLGAIFYIANYDSKKCF